MTMTTNELHGLQTAAPGELSTFSRPSGAHAHTASGSAHPANAPYSMGAILVDAGRLSVDKAEAILRCQKERGLRFGAAALELGLLTEEDIRFALARQFDYPCLDASDGSLSAELVAAYQPYSSVVEQLRSLRSQLMLRWFENDVQPVRGKALVIASPERNEGRSYIAANLAVVFSQLGERTLLIDANLRQPRLHEFFKLSSAPGLSDLLAGRADPKVAQRIPSLLGLSVLPAGTLPPNPLELIGRSAFSEALQSYSEDFDVILIDSPAFTAGTDVLTLTARSGAALLLARTDQSSLPALTNLKNSLQDAGGRVLGSVLNT